MSVSISQTLRNWTFSDIIESTCVCSIIIASCSFASINCSAISFVLLLGDWVIWRHKTLELEELIQDVKHSVHTRIWRNIFNESVKFLWYTVLNSKIEIIATQLSIWIYDISVSFYRKRTIKNSNKRDKTLKITHFVKC